MEGEGLMWQQCTTRVERVLVWILEQVGQLGRVDVCKPGHATREVRRIVVCTEHAAKPLVAQALKLGPNGKIYKMFTLYR